MGRSHDSGHLSAVGPGGPPAARRWRSRLPMSGSPAPRARLFAPLPRFSFTVYGLGRQGALRGGGQRLYDRKAPMTRQGARSFVPQPKGGLIDNLIQSVTIQESAVKNRITSLRSEGSAADYPRRSGVDVRLETGQRFSSKRCRRPNLPD